MVVLHPSAREDAVRRLLDGTRTQCVVQPCDGNCFPAAISVRCSLPQGRPVHAVVRVDVLAGEPEAFFAAGQPFTLWADAIVDNETIRGEGLLGHSVTTGHDPEVSPALSGHGAPQTTARQALRYRRTVPQPRPCVGASPMAGGR